MPLEEEKGLLLSFDFFSNSVSFSKLQTLQGSEVTCPSSAVTWVRPWKEAADLPARPLLANSPETDTCWNFMSVFR